MTDAGVISGPISNEKISWRNVNGYTQFVPPGFNQELLAAAGFRLLLVEDRTVSVVLNAGGRLKARSAHRAAFEKLEGKESFARQQRYLEIVVELSERGALSRTMYLAELAAV